YYCFFHWYVRGCENTGKSDAYFSCVVGISFLQCGNILFLISIIGNVYFDTQWISNNQTDVFAFLLPTIILLINFLLYRNLKTSNAIKRKFMHWSESKKKLYKTLSIAYIILSIGCFFYSI